jgi:hypothetical protein
MASSDENKIADFLQAMKTIREKASKMNNFKDMLSNSEPERKDIGDDVRQKCNEILSIADNIDIDEIEAICKDSSDNVPTLMILEAIDDFQDIIDVATQLLD